MTKFDDTIKVLSGDQKNIVNEPPGNLYPAK